MAIPVIILNYNSSNDSRKCIGFLKQQRGVETEIVVVDNCSPRQGEQEAIKHLCKEQSCTFIQANENRGYNAGNNIGLRYAAEKGYRYALIANPDMEFPQTDYLKRMVETMEQDENIVVCGSDIITLEGKHQNPQRESTYWEDLFWAITIIRYRGKNWFLQDASKSGYCNKVSGCCLLVRISFIVEIGYFDETVFLYSEESILGMQVKYSNYRMYYLADAVATHHHIKSEKGKPSHNIALLFKSRRYYYKRYSGYKGLKLQMLLASQKIQQLLYKICFHS